MTAALVHPLVLDELAAGNAQAGAFLEQVVAHVAHREPIEADALAQAIELARMGSMARARGFAARLQEVLVEAGHATS